MKDLPISILDGGSIVSAGWSKKYPVLIVIKKKVKYYVYFDSKDGNPGRCRIEKPGLNKEKVGFSIPTK